MAAADERARATFIEATDGAAVPVSAANTGRLRYNDGAGTWEQSSNGGAYTALGGGSGSGSALIRNSANGSVFAIIPGNAVSAATAAGFTLADKTAAVGRFKVFGLAKQAIGASPAAGDIVTHGELVLTTAEWDAVTGQVGGLTPGGYYYLGAVGGISTSVIGTPGTYQIEIGIALNATTMMIQIKDRVLF